MEAKLEHRDVYVRHTGPCLVIDILHARSGSDPEPRHALKRVEFMDELDPDLTYGV